MLSAVLLLGMPGAPEWILILVIVLVLFGGKKIPELLKGVGSGIREFNNAKDQVKTTIEEGMRAPTEPQKVENAPTPAPTVAATDASPVVKEAPAAPASASSTATK